MKLVKTGQRTKERMKTAIKGNENRSGKINRTNCKKGSCKRRGESPELLLPSDKF